MRLLLAVGALGLLALMLSNGGNGVVAASSSSLQEQIDRAQPGDTLTISGGVYNERIVIDKSLELEGQGSPVIDGGGEGDVVTISADNVTLSGFTVRNSGQAVSQEPAAIKIGEVVAATIERNHIEDARFGIHATGTRDAVIANNQIDLDADTPIERRGHAIYLWQVTGAAIHENHISRAGDGIHLEFSDDNGIALNTVTGSRYALHFMYSNNNRIIQNEFRDNLSGAVIMLSHDILVKDNELSGNRDGATGAGMLLKDVDNIFADGNRVLRNKYGLMADGTPEAAGATATFMNNLFALNDTGLGLMTSAPISFVHNAMIENTVQVESLGGDLMGMTMGQPAAAAPAPSSSNMGTEGVSGRVATWSVGGRGNYWSDYTGYDADGDGVGDRAYLPEPAFAGAMEDSPTLRLFQFTIAQEAIDMASKMFPIYRYDPVIEDSSPLMSPPGPALPKESGLNGGLLAVSILLVALALAVLQVAFDIDPVRGLLRQGRKAGGLLNRGAA
jgi:nitrous oxidase accessory protein